MPSISSVSRLGALAVGAAVALARPAAADGGEQRAWIRTIPDAATWKAYSKTMNADEFGKCVIDIKKDEIYFIDVNLFNLHADFVLGVLLKQAWTRENIIEYNKNYERVKPHFILCYLTHHTKLDKWTLSFWEGDKIDAAGVMSVKDKLEGTFWKAKDLYFRPDSVMQEKVAKDVAKKKFRTITNDELYKSADFQPFNRGKTFGTLPVVPLGTPYD